MRIATAAALAAGVLFAQAPASTPPPGAGTPAHRVGARYHPGRIIRALNLTDAQKQQAKAIFQQARQTAQPVRQQLQQNRQTLKQAVIGGNADAQIQQLSTQQGVLHGQIIAIRSEAWAQFLTVLTPEQRTQASQMMP